jgi:hypothetical protein
MLFKLLQTIHPVATVAPQRQGSSSQPRGPQESAITPPLQDLYTGLHRHTQYKAFQTTHLLTNQVSDIIKTMFDDKKF